MNEYTIHSAKMVPLDRSNIDTDQIIPKQFLKSIKKTGFGPNLFDSWRYLDSGFPGQDNSKRQLNPEFVLNDKKYKGSEVLISKENFGCGSSREHAVWAMQDYGIKCVIAQSFADIFYNNCFKNGMLPIVLDQKQLEELIEYSERKEAIEINLPEQKIKLENKIISFEVDAYKKKCLLDGLDDIALSLEKSNKITSYEKNIQKTKPWMN